MPVNHQFTGIEPNMTFECGEGGIRTLGSALRHYDGLANR